jgi:hypothetical protein
VFNASLMMSCCEMGWLESKYCMTLSQSWSMRCSRTVLGLLMAKVQLILGAWGAWGA